MITLIQKNKLLLEKLFLYFLIFSSAGWIYEVLVYWLEYGEGLLNRGFLFGPYLPIYGLGGIPIILLTRWFIQKNGLDKNRMVCFMVVFFGSVLITTLVELISSYILEATIGYWLWDYTRYTIQFQGRIALTTSIRFGLLFLVGYFIVVPVIDMVVERLAASHDRQKDLVVLALFALIILDTIIHLIIGPNCVVR